jgi:hypothetical protein
MSRILGVTLAAVVCGCGGAPPAYESNFLGLWQGSLTESDTDSGDVIAGGQSELAIQGAGTNLVKLDNICYGGVGPDATVTSATAFSGSMAFNCRPSGNEDCSSIVLTINTISGTLTGSTLDVDVKTTFSGCGLSENVTLDFTGTHVPGT